MVLEQHSFQMQKKKKKKINLNRNFTPFTKLIQNGSQTQMQHKTIKLLENNIEGNLDYFV